jgi:hypothetical protein
MSERELIKLQTLHPMERFVEAMAALVLRYDDQS